MPEHYKCTKPENHAAACHCEESDDAAISMRIPGSFLCARNDMLFEQRLPSLVPLIGHWVI